MTEKARIIDALGEPTLLLPALLGEALGASDRIKYNLSLLQAARTSALHPQQPAAPLVAERCAAGIDDERLDTLPARAERDHDGQIHIPDAGILCDHIVRDLDALLAPIRSAGAEAAVALSARAAALRSQPWCESCDTFDAGQFSRLTSADRDAGDSVHLLVLDAHKELNRLQTRIASEDIDGAAAYDIRPADRALIAAFMRGVNASRPLKLDHPGLGTTATRSGGRLVLQNDIGTTDAHVLVVHVENRRVTLTYTDVHLQRLLFFQSLFAHWAVSWEDTRSRRDRGMEDGLYHVSVGTFSANNDAGLGDYLSFLGSRLVFLIDWNRARKRLRLLLPKKETLDLLHWAADENVGHMAWLRSGGEQLVFDAVAFAARTPPTFGARLDDMLDPGKAVGFMQSVLRACTRGFLERRPDEVVRDEIRAELATCFRSARQQIIDIVAEHAAFSIEIATGIRDCLPDLTGPDAAARIAANAARARQWEQRADERLNQARELRQQQGEWDDFYHDLVARADDITDELEEAAFHLTLFPPEAPSAELLECFATLAGLAVSGAQEFLKAVETARGLRRGGPREDIQDFLAAIHQILVAERQSDDTHRRFKQCLVATPGEFRSHYPWAEFARNLETACDALLHAALQLRDHIMLTVTRD